MVKSGAIKCSLQSESNQKDRLKRNRKFDYSNCEESENARPHKSGSGCNYRADAGAKFIEILVCLIDTVHIIDSIL